MMNEFEYMEYASKLPTAWKGHGSFAIKLVKLLQPRVTVDLGVDFGYSTFCFGYSMVGDVYGIDWFKGDNQAGFRDTYSMVMRMYDSLKVQHGVNNIKFIKSDFNKAAKNWLEEIDILHIDGFHTYEAVSEDYQNWSKFCNEKSVILFHDTRSYPDSVGKFFNELEGYKLEKLDWYGLGIFTKDEEIYKKIKEIL